MSDLIKIGHFSPSKNPYSETFIQAHKKFLKGKVFYYYGQRYSKQLEGGKQLVNNYYRIYFKLKQLALRKPGSYFLKKLVLKSLIKNKINILFIEYGNHAFDVLELLHEINLPVIIHFHGFDSSVYSEIKRCNHYKEVFERATYVVAVSKKMKQVLEGFGCPSNKIIYSPCGPQEEFYTVLPKFAKKQFLSVGRFVDKKAPYYTIMAFKEVFKVHPDAKLFMAGDGALFNTCKNIVEYYRLGDNVRFLGVIDKIQIKKLFEESLAFVQHSITAESGDTEGTPVSVMEASLAGLPVISTKHAGIPDVILHQKTGLLVEEHDVLQMTQYMLSLLENFELAKQLGQSGKEYIHRNFSLSHHISTLQKYINISVNNSIN